MCSEENFNVNLGNLVQDLRDQSSSEEHVNESFNIEKCLLELKTELHIKKEKVKQNRIDLEEANDKIIGLKGELSTVHQQYKDKIFQLNILTKKSKSLEDELNEKRDTLLKIQMLHKMTIGELDTLKKNLQKSELEKHEFMKNLEHFKTKQLYNSNYHSEILKRENSLKNLIKEIEKNAEKLISEQDKLKEQVNRTKSLVNSKIQLNIERKYEDLKKQKEEIDERYVHIKAKTDKIEEFITPANQTRYQPNTLTKYNYNMWKEARSSYQKELLEKNELLSNLQEAYENEKTLRVKIMSQKKQLQVANEILKQENDDLNMKRMYEEFGVENDNVKENGDQAKIKTEVILIEDDE